MFGKTMMIKATLDSAQLSHFELYHGLNMAL
jgi:hypothetical protein